MGYRMIIAVISDRIRKGDYRPGERLPTVRETAAEFGCNKATAQKAYDALQKEGLIVSVVGKGSFVPRRPLLPGSGGLFQSAYISHTLFPHEDFSRLIQDLFLRDGSACLEQPPLPGDPDLIEVLSRFYSLPEERLLIVSGAQQGLDITRSVLSIDDPARIIFEDPSYPGAAALFMPGSFVPMTPEGPDPLLVREKALKTGARLLYTIPSVHNPTGYRYSPRVKRELCSIAREMDLYLIEDDSLSEFFPDPSPRFLDLAPERTFYIKSLAKSTVSGNRLGILVPPPPFFNAMMTAKSLTDISTSGLLQRAASRFIREGYFQAFIEKVLPVHRERREKLLHVLQDIPLFSVQESFCGFWLWVRLNREVDIATPPWTEGRFFSPSPENRSFFRLAYMNMEAEEFSRGLLQIRRMAQTLSW